jgi:Uma2 family endonuclease
VITETAADIVRRLTDGYENGIYTDLEVVGALVSAAATHQPADLARGVPPEWLEEVKQRASDPPHAPFSGVWLSGVLLWEEADNEASEARQRLEWFEGVWAWHRYFASQPPQALEASGMSTVKKLNLVTVEEYLAGELVSPIKHEYLDGVVYAMAGARNVHNLIASNTLGSLYARLRGRVCRAFNSDTKIRVRLPTQVRFYYPGVSVVCRSNPPTDSFQDDPAVLVEVLSRSTRRIDEGEKRDAYLTIPSLSVYLLVEQDTAAVVAFRRTAGGFVREVYEGLDAVIPLGEIGTDLPQAEIYETVQFAPEPEEDEAT